MAAVSGSENHRYAELTVDSFFSRDEASTKLINYLGREIRDVEKMGLHQAKIPLTFHTIFEPHNTLTLAGFTYEGTMSPFNTVYQTPSALTSTYTPGSPNATTAQAFFGKSFNSNTLTAVGGASFRLRSPFGIVGTPIAVCNNVVNGGQWTGYEVRHLAGCTIGVNAAGSGFNLYVVVQSVNGTPTSDFKGKLTFHYSKYLGRKLGLPDSGTWTVNLADYSASITTTTGSANADVAPFVYTEAGSWNSGANPNWAYYTIPFTFNFEMNMGRYLVLRGTLSENMQSMVFTNNEEAQDSDVVAVLPISGSYGDIVEYDTPNFEVFEFPRPVSIKYLNLWFTRAEDNLNIPINFNGVDYMVKFALAIRTEFKQVQTLDPEKNVWATHNVRTFKPQ